MRLSSSPTSFLPPADGSFFSAGVELKVIATSMCCDNSLISVMPPWTMEVLVKIVSAHLKIPETKILHPCLRILAVLLTCDYESFWGGGQRLALLGSAIGSLVGRMTNADR